MKKIVFVVASRSCCFLACFFSQDTTTNFNKLSISPTIPHLANSKRFKLPSRPGDHFMLQLSSDHWTAMPDSISAVTRKAFRAALIYFMLDEPFL